MRKQNKVLIGMSGGVDSSVASYILQKKGYEVTGLSIRTCNNDSTDAKNIAKLLNIEFLTLNKESDFNKYVIQYFINTYKEGKTPNPCVICNRYVKYQALLDKAKGLGINYIATGHYVRIKYDKKNKRYILKKAKDKTKDQSYVLYNLTQEQLSKCIFPLGEYRKKDIRKIAHKLNMELADKPDSQDICFIPDNDYPTYLKDNSNITDEEGSIVDTEGNILGKHNGLSKYTIGQRKGIGISAKKPLYVVTINMKNNRLVVGEEADIYNDELIATNINYVSIENLVRSMKVSAKIRYSTTESKATITPLENGNIMVKFDEKQRAITAGQSVVFYNKDLLLGGGTIV